ncbi:MAG TPA: transposase [Longimicrobiales bacterium]
MEMARSRVQFGGMGRRKRPHHPGMVFHLVSRTHRREPWFTPQLRPAIVDLIHRMVGRTDAQLLAYAVMPNHLHLVLRQGRGELSGVMQPLLRRVALRVQRQHGFEGGVVERRFRDRSCMSPDHVRSAIIYTHLNPWRAGLCGDDLAYEWTSHRAYLPGADPTEFGIDKEVQGRVLELFAEHEHCTRDELCRRYLASLDWRMRMDRVAAGFQAADTADPLFLPAPTVAGDAAWARYFSADARGETDGDVPLPDLRDFLRGQLDRYEPGMMVTELRGSWLPRSTARLRANLIRAAAERGYRTGAIARFFDIAPQSVSRARYSRSR